MFGRTLTILCALLIARPALAFPEFNLGVGYVNSCQNGEAVSEDNSDGAEPLKAETCFYGGRGKLLLNLLYRERMSIFDFFDFKGPGPNGGLGGGSEAIAFVLGAAVAGVIFGVVAFFAAEIKLGLSYNYDSLKEISGNDRATRQMFGLDTTMYLLPFFDWALFTSLGYVQQEQWEEELPDEKATRSGFAVKFGTGYVPSAASMGLFLTYEGERSFLAKNAQEFFEKSAEESDNTITNTGAVIMGWKTRY